ncbi:hypothetical protein DER29_0362 [Micromonospora sp. M71_S20]|uniref:hypothetical protein n=1 Tax=Micromonospora sp. M71_S20 TaxID=592872 RepID=UPI000F0D33D7|nr:hypothetical protein [Micromonospora sp. M71_S20]RLK22528.1 hypothetical protein DER29_0362 [Micromonospora sp. M71_S20]
MKAHRMDQETVERLLDGPVLDPQDGPQPVTSLLTAVRAPGRAGELAGEEAAVRAYRLARAGSPLGPPQPRRRPALAGFGVRAALAGAALALTGGVALAATGGVLPHPLRGPAPTTAAPVPAPTTDSSTTTRHPPSAPTGGADGRPEPDARVRELCRAYRADAGDRPGGSPDGAAFGDLIDAAGGPGEVAGYCERVLADEPKGPGPHGSPSGGPAVTPTGRPGADPTGRPGVDPTGRPAVAPTGRPGVDPTGRPGAEPTGRRTGPPTASPSATAARPARPGPVHVSPAQGRHTAAPSGGDAG